VTAARFLRTYYQETLLFGACVTWCANMSPKSSIPSWQRATSLPGAEDLTPEAATPPPADSSDAAASDVGPEDLKEQARKFLEDPSIKDASPERKIAFLEAKGLKREDVESLVGKDEVKEVLISTAFLHAQTANDTSRLPLHSLYRLLLPQLYLSKAHLQSVKCLP
jgi:hypothetical protein